MAWRNSLNFVVNVVLMVLSLSPWVYSRPDVPCYFIFGASAYDNGNNNNLPTVAKANYLPYGIDFPQGATGRFTNGRTTSDIIAELLGFKNYIPSFASMRGWDLRTLKGVNYASGGSGIRNETGRNLGARISMDEQLQNHQMIVSRISKMVRNPDIVAKYLGKCLYSVGMGTNDYINNYFRPQFYNTSQQYTPQQYAAVLIQQFSQQLGTLYNLGARKIALFGIFPIGCAPAVLAAAGTNSSSCVDGVNNAIQLFNVGLRALVDDLNSRLTDAKFTYLNAYQIYSSSASGFVVRNAPCCPVSPMTAMCTPLGTPCSNRGDYIWWDGIHQSEASNRNTATRSYTAQSASDTYPFDIHTLAHL